MVVSVIRLKQTAQPIVFRNNILNTYQKGDLYCIAYVVDGERRVRRIPIANIFDIDETY